VYAQVLPVEGCALAMSKTRILPSASSACQIYYSQANLLAEPGSQHEASEVARNQSVMLAEN